MKNINLIGEFTGGGGENAANADKSATIIFDGARRRLVEVKLRRNAILQKHRAAEPITVFCLAGEGTFRAGENLSESQALRAGTLITLEAGIEHEVLAAPELRLLVTKFKPD